MSLDLLAWQEIRDAEAALTSAHAEQAEAARRFKLAPHGQRTVRLAALQEALQKSLAAELQLARIKKAEG